MMKRFDSIKTNEKEVIRLVQDITVGWDIGAIQSTVVNQLFQEITLEASKNPNLSIPMHLWTSWLHVKTWDLEWKSRGEKRFKSLHFNPKEIGKSTQELIKAVEPILKHNQNHKLADDLFRVLIEVSNDDSINQTADNFVRLKITKSDTNWRMLLQKYAQHRSASYEKLLQYLYQMAIVADIDCSDLKPLIYDLMKKRHGNTGWLVSQQHEFYDLLLSKTLFYVDW
jgi:hypothetical protein